MSETISIGELEAAERAMTPGEWECNEPNLSIQGDISHRDGPVMIAELTGEAMMADGPGLVALRNAAPVLLAIAAAALEWKRVMSDDADHKAQDAACEDLDEALKAVRP